MRELIKMRVGKGPAALLGWEMGPRQDPRLVLAPRRQPAGCLGIGGGLRPGRREAQRPSSHGQGPRQSDPTLPKREKGASFLVAFTDPGLPGWGRMGQERVGCQPGSAVAGVSMPWGQTARSYRSLGRLPSLRRRNFHPLLKERRSQ